MAEFRLPGTRCEPVTLYGNPVLRQPARPVTVFDRSVRKLVDDLFRTMREIETGVGLAANQIGRHEAVFVFDCGGDNVGCVVNPRIELLGEDLEPGGEGCLSLPGVTLLTERHSRARVTGADLDGTPLSIEASGLLARCFQHETHHLEGRLYIDLHPAEVRDAVDADLRSSEWYGTAAIDPRSPVYLRAQQQDRFS